jgi:hypothetical protein
MLNKKQNIILGIALLIVGIISFSFSISVYTSPKKSFDVYLETSIFLDRCISESRRYGFISSIGTENDITFTPKKIDINNPSDLVARSGLLIRSCENFELVEYCLGEDCQNNVQKNKMYFIMKIAPLIEKENNVVSETSK